MSDNYINKTGLAYFWNKIKSALAGKQETLVSGSNIKTINGSSILGSGNLEVGATAMTDAEVEAAVDAGWVDTFAFWIVAFAGQEECLAENGMTWSQWVDSEYNTIGCYIDGGYIWYGSFYVDGETPTSVISHNTYPITGGGNN